jgi:mRNA interferase RelE/StbE
MVYGIEFKPQAFKDMKAIPKKDAESILFKIEGLRDHLRGDVKRLKNFVPKYRLRAGIYRVLFETEGYTVVIYRILHRRKSYD